jgi:hypothetical protein
LPGFGLSFAPPLRDYQQTEAPAAPRSGAPLASMRVGRFCVSDGLKHIGPASHFENLCSSPVIDRLRMRVSPVGDVAADPLAPIKWPFSLSLVKARSNLSLALIAVSYDT